MILPSPFRLVVDLNVWTKDFQAEVAKERHTDAQTVIDAVMDGRGGFGAIELVMSHSMLSRLETVLARKMALAKGRLEARKGKPGDLVLARRTPESLARYIDNIKMAMAIGPYMVLGGGVFPSSETFRDLQNDRSPKGLQWPDPEDGRVIDTAVAARAHAIVTDNFKDFVSYDDTRILQNRLHVRRTAAHDVLIAHFEEMADFLRRGFPKVVEDAVLKVIQQSPPGAGVEGPSARL